MKPKHEIRNGVAYLQCGTFSTRTKMTCENLLPLDRFGRFEGRCGRCGSTTKLSAWWLSETQRSFQEFKQTIREKVSKGQLLTVQEFDRVAKEHL